MEKVQFVITLLLIVILCCSCANSGIPREEYEKVVAERDAWKEEYEELTGDNNSLLRAKEAFSYDESITVSESRGKLTKTLVLVGWVEFGSDTGDYGEKIGETLQKIKNEEWFDYDYVFWETWSDTVTRIVSVTIDVDDLENYKTYQWYGND